MNRRNKITLFSAAALIIASISGVAVYYYAHLLSAGAAYKAKTLGSCIFVSHRDAVSILTEDLAADDLSLLKKFDTVVDRERRRVTAGFFGLFQRTAVCRPGLGCTVVYDKDLPPHPGVTAPVAPPLLPVAYDSRFDRALDWAFSEPDPSRLRRTRAVVILHKGRIVAERYAPGFDRDTPLLGWSMTKSVTNALVGIMVREGRQSLHGPLPISPWRSPGDPRGQITMHHLLQMSSGLEFAENYKDPFQDVLKMLFAQPDMGAYAAGKELEAEPGTLWKYSSGTTNIISLAVRKVHGEQGYDDLPRRALFNPVGMASAVMEQDASGTFVGSSYMYATARDWARFGQLYLQDGLWEGRRILPEGWVSYTLTPAASAPEKQYGAHFWLKVPREFRSDQHEKLVPADAFHAAGHEGQFVSVIPSRQMVIVRLGLARFPSAWKHDEFIGRVLASVPDE